MFRKIFVTGIAAAVVFACAACGAESETVQKTDSSNKSSNTVETATKSAVSEDCMQKVYDALVASGSDYSELKEMDTIPSTASLWMAIRLPYLLKGNM